MKVNIIFAIVSSISDIYLHYLGDSPDLRKVTYQLNMEDEKWRDAQIQQKI